MLKSASFKIYSADPGRNSSPTPAETGCAFGLFPKFSTPVEKTVEIRIDPPLSFGFRLILRGFYKGESEKYCETGASHAVKRRRTLKMALLMEAKGLHGPGS